MIKFGNKNNKRKVKNILMFYSFNLLTPTDKNKRSYRTVTKIYYKYSPVIYTFITCFIFLMYIKFN